VVLIVAAEIAQTQEYKTDLTQNNGPHLKGISKLITSFMPGMSMPRVSKSVHTRTFVMLQKARFTFTYTLVEIT
jgi:hypothetical protein